MSCFPIKPFFINFSTNGQYLLLCKVSINANHNLFLLFFFLSPWAIKVDNTSGSHQRYCVIMIEMFRMHRFLKVPNPTLANEIFCQKISKLITRYIERKRCCHIKCLSDYCSTACCVVAVFIYNRFVNIRIFCA